MIPTLSFWITLTGRLAVEAGLLVALAAAAQPWVATPWRRRALWQAALLGIALAWAAELGGWRQEVLRRWPESRPKAQVMVRTTTEAIPAFDVAPVVVTPPPARTSQPITVPKAVWWPLRVWAVGTILLGLRALSVRVWLLMTALRRSRVGDPRVLARVEALRDRVGLNRVRVVSWPGLRSPIAFGWLVPTIALPTDFTVRFEDEAQEAILAHELAHLSARDPLWLGVADAVLALAWWHPAVWWSRHQLRAACESAADDASALIPGGRVRLAELLVVLGRDLVSPGWTRGLGVAGDGFKSQLARRVTTLLKATHDWRADRSSRLGWSRALALGVTALLVAIPWPGTGGPALTALIQEARANAAASKEKLTSDSSRSTPVIGYSKAYSAPRPALGDESTNAFGYEQSNLIPNAGFETTKSPSVEILSTNWINPGSSTYVRIPGFATPPPSRGEPWVKAQLDQLVLSEVEIFRGTVSSALEKLSRLSTKADPEGIGLNLLSIHDEERPDVSTALVSDRIQLRQVTLREALEAVAKASTIPMGLVVDQSCAYLERIRPGKTLGQSLVHPRWWLVETNAFWSMIRSNRPASADLAGAMNELREFFGTKGIVFPEPAYPSVPMPNSLSFAFSGRLMVFAKASELDQIDQILAPVKAKPASRAAVTLAAIHTESPAPDSSTPPVDLLERIQKVDARLKELRTHYKDNHPKVQEAIAERIALVGGASAGATNRFVKMEVKLVEVRETGSSGPGLDWVFGPAQTNQVAPTVGSSLAAEEARNENYHVDLFRTVGEVAAITPVQFAALIKRLENQDGNEVLSTPVVLTENGRQSVVSVTEMVSMVDGVHAVPGSATHQAQIQYDTSKVPVGPSVEMLPLFVGDALRMHILAKITEFQGYDQPKAGQSVQTTDAKGKKIEGIQPLPHLRVRVAVADPVLRRGETAVLRGPVVTETVRVKDKVPVLGDVPLLGRLFRSEATNSFKKRLYVFVTPTEMDSAGNPK